MDFVNINQVWLEINQIPQSFFQGNRESTELTDQMDEEPSLIHYQVFKQFDKYLSYI